MRGESAPERRRSLISPNNATLESHTSGQWPEQFSYCTRLNSAVCTGLSGGNGVSASTCTVKRRRAG
jgi:hypothetical protein